MKLVIGINTYDKSSRLTKFLSFHYKYLDHLKYDIFLIMAKPKNDNSNKKKTLNDKNNKNENYEIKSRIFYKTKVKVFYADCHERYENLAHKLAIFYDYCKDKYDGVIKVDDGCRLDFSKIIILPNNKHEYIGALMKATSQKCHFGKCKNKEFNSKLIDFDHNFEKKDIDNLNMTEMRYCGGGYAYYLSNNCLKIISKYLDHILKIDLSYEDVLFGQILNMNGIKPKYYKFGDYHKIK